MIRSMTSRTLSLSLLVSSLALSACHQRVAMNTHNDTIELTHSHVSMGMLGVAERYTFQGVLEFNGQPLVGDVPVDVRIEDGEGGIINGGEDSVIVTCDDQGRFTTTFPLPLPPELVDGVSPVIILTLGEQGQELEPIPMAWAPRAWASNYAETSLFAFSANTANSATTAGTAGTASSLSDVDEFDLDGFYETGWIDYSVAGWQAPRATRRGNMVFLEGIVENTGAGSTVIMTLPPPLRPELRHLAIAYGQDTAVGAGAGPVYRIDIQSNGTVSVIGANVVGDWISLQGIAFRLD